MSCGPLRLCLATVVVLLTLAATAGAGTVPRCFGAAARDAVTPCANPALRFSVTPSPALAPILPNAPCTPIRSPAPPNVCWFGSPKGRASASIALLGDSHASAWRAAVAQAATGRGWHGLTVRRSSCPFTAATVSAAPAQQRSCARWYRDSLAWFARHPEVSTVFVAASSYTGVVAPAGGDPYAAAVAGFKTAFEALPASVSRIIVLRDSPRAATTTLACVHDAASRHRRADLRCALPRSGALLRDAAVDAAAQLPAGRAGVIDLTDFFCDSTLCYPVVGGALVFKDISHLTDTFSQTLGPYLLARYLQLQGADAGPAPQ